MNITLADWQRIAAAKEAASTAIGELERALIEVGFIQNEQGALDCPEAKLLIGTLLPIVDDAKFQISRLDVHPQSEWMGGDSSDAKNFKIREPNCVPMPRGYLE